jgi:hypothetical protein
MFVDCYYIRIMCVRSAGASFGRTVLLKLSDVVAKAWRRTQSSSKNVRGLERSDGLQIHSSRFAQRRSSDTIPNGIVKYLPTSVHLFLTNTRLYLVLKILFALSLTFLPV